MKIVFCSYHKRVDDNQLPHLYQRFEQHAIAAKPTFLLSTEREYRKFVSRFAVQQPTSFIRRRSPPLFVLPSNHADVCSGVDELVEQRGDKRPD